MYIGVTSDNVDPTHVSVVYSTQSRQRRDGRILVKGGAGDGGVGIGRGRGVGVCVCGVGWGGREGGDRG